LADDKTLVVLTPGFASNEADTTCLPFLQSHILAIKKNDPSLEIIIIAFQYPFFKRQYKWNGITVVSFGGESKAKWHRLLLWLKVWKYLKKLKREKNIIGFFSLWSTECALIGHYFGERYGIRSLTWLCGQDAKKDNKYVKLIRPKGNELIAMSDFLNREFHKNHGITPEYVIPIGIDPTQFADKNHIRNIDLLGVGSLIPLKQYDIFVQVVDKLKHKFPSIKAMICGKGPEEQRLVDMLQSKGLTNKLELKGEIPHNEVLELMQRTKIFLHTSNYEGFGTVCLEALYGGAHVVSFTKPMDATISHWHHVKDIDEMVKKLIDLLEDKHIKHTPIIPYSTADIAQTMMKLFER